MQSPEIVFFISAFLVFYNYIGYAIIASMFNYFSKPGASINNNKYSLPSVSFIVTAYNEEDFIEKKISNSLTLNYPSDKIEFIFITDGSTDKTNEIISRYTLIKLLYQPERRGKSAALNRAVGTSLNDILIFSDANTSLNDEAILNIVRHYHNEKVGGVAGEKKVVSFPRNNDEVIAVEGLYWKYESALKKIDSDFYSVVGAAGELLSVRRNLFEPVSTNVILDDFIMSLKIAKKSYRIIYEPKAYAIELPSFSIKDEQKRKIRIAAGGFQAIRILTDLLKFWKYPRLSFLYISHRFLRWAVSPFCIIIVFISNIILLFTTNNILFEITFIIQVIFYLMALSCRIHTLSRFKLFKLAYYFTFMNVSVIQGFFRYLKGTQSAIWEKSKKMT